MRLTSSRSLILPGQVLGKYSYLSSSMSGMTAAVTWLPSHNTSSLLIGLGGNHSKLKNYFYEAASLLRQYKK